METQCRDSKHKGHSHAVDQGLVVGCLSVEDIFPKVKTMGTPYAVNMGGLVTVPNW
jgi:hypothetical protein